MTDFDVLGTGADAELILEPSQETAAPRVVVVVVASNPGPWFERCLSALGDLNYENLSVLVIDASSDSNQLRRVAQALPNAYVRRLRDNPGYAASTNRAMRIITGADYLVLCHDDVAPEPNSLRSMVIKAERTGAKVVTPKYLGWDDDHLISVGGTVDLTATYLPLA